MDASTTWHHRPLSPLPDLSAAPPAGGRDLRLLPKAECHVHLTGAMRQATLVELAARAGMQVPTALDGMHSVRPGSWRRFQATYDAARSAVRDEVALRQLVTELAEDARDDGAGWVEVQVTPPGYAASLHRTAPGRLRTGERVRRRRARRGRRRQPDASAVGGDDAGAAGGPPRGAGGGRPPPATAASDQCLSRGADVPARHAYPRRAPKLAEHADASQAQGPAGLWEAARAGDDDARERLILQYAPLVKYVAGRVGSGLPASVDSGDLVGYGMMGLLDAVARYEPAQGPFEPYALPRIRGAILDELRSLDWVPRSVRAKSRELERATAVALSRGRGTASEADIAAEMGVAVPTLRHILSEVSYRRQVALDAPVAGSSDDVDAASHLADLLADPGATDPAGAAADADTPAPIVARCVEAHGT